MNLKFLNGLLQVTHPDGWLQGAMYMLLGAFLGGSLQALQEPNVFRATLAVILVIAAGFAFNDFHDAQVDEINKPKRAIPSGHISRITALVLSGLLTIGMIIIAWPLPSSLRSIAFSNVILSILYTLYLKNIPFVGHLCVAYLNTTIILFGCITVTTPTLTIWFVSIGGFFFTLAQETILVVEDFSGDRTSGINTTAVRLGVSSTLYIFRILALLPIVVMVLPWFLNLTSDFYLLALLPCTIMPLLYAIRLVTPKFTEEKIRLSSKLILWSRALSLLPVLLLGFTR